MGQTSRFYHNVVFYSYVLWLELLQIPCFNRLGHSSPTLGHQRAAPSEPAEATNDRHSQRRRCVEGAGSTPSPILSSGARRSRLGT